MSGGMRDYEGWDEVRAFKTELFAHVQKNDDVVEIGIGSAPNLQYYGSKAKRVRAVEPNAAFFDLAATQAQWEDTTLDVVQGVAEALDDHRAPVAPRRRGAVLRLAEHNQT